MYFIVLKLKTIYLDLCLPAYFKLCLPVLLFCYSFSDNFSLFLADVNSLSLLSCKDLCIYPLYFDIIVVMQVSNSLRMEFLGDILKSHAIEYLDNFPEDLQVMIKDLDRM